MSNRTPNNSYSTQNLLKVCFLCCKQPTVPGNEFGWQIPTNPNQLCNLGQTASPIPVQIRRSGHQHSYFVVCCRKQATPTVLLVIGTYILHMTSSVYYNGFYKYSQYTYMYNQDSVLWLGHTNTYRLIITCNHSVSLQHT